MKSIHARCGKLIACFRNKKGKEETDWAMKNGRKLLEESISLFDGKVNHIRYFSARELEIATNNFDERQLLFDSLYRGFIQGREVFVKRCNGRFWENWVRGIVVASRLSAHINVLKPIGCCLETQVPQVIYESFDSPDLLHDCLGMASYSYSNRHDLQPSLPWKHRLKIAVDLSNIVAYLHTALHRPLVYRDINPSNVILDKENGIIKLCNFELCMFLSEEEPFIEDQPIVGTIGYLDPEYYRTARFNEKVDVYGFGVTLLNLLSGRHAIYKESPRMEGSLVLHVRYCMENKRFEEILDPRLSAADGPWPGKNRQFEAVLMLALECTRDRGIDRPDMTHVGTRLAGMYRSVYSGS